MLIKQNERIDEFVIDKEKKLCNGCGACLQVCSYNAISVSERNGFYYPKIDKNCCIDCGLCDRVCSINKLKNKDNHNNNFFAIKNKNNHIRHESTSGGVFYELASNIINLNGTVYGAIFDESFKVRHSRLSTLKELKKAMGAKYVQSDLHNTYNDIIHDLKDGRMVLFCGTPCQSEGLNRIVKLKGIDHINLINCDIVCHGVPSPVLWEDYKKMIKKNRKIQSFKFRDKNIGWRGSNVTVKFSNGKILSNMPFIKNYSNMYFKGLSIRESCFSCEYTCVDRNSDLSIGDFWGVENFYNDFNDEKGVSLVITHSRKGENFLKEILRNCEYIETKCEKSLQPQLQHPTEKPENYLEFWNYYYKNGYKAIAKKYGDYNIKGYIECIKVKIKYCIRRLTK